MPRKKSKGGSKQAQQSSAPPPPQHSQVPQDDEEDNSTDSVEQAAREGAIKDDNMDQDSLMFEGIDDIDLPQDDDDSGRDLEHRDMHLDVGASAGSPDELPFDETDSVLNTPFGSPLSAISSFSNIQKWTGEVKKMLLDDQQQSENRFKGWVFPSPEVPPTFSSAGRTEGFSDLEEGDFDVMPTTEELAEKYSNELIEKERSILLKDAKILELERSLREIKNNFEDCQKELKQTAETGTSGVEKLKQTLEEKDKCIMETSEKLRKVTESYNSSEQRWKEQQAYLEDLIKKLKTDLESKSSLGAKLERLQEEFRVQQHDLEDQLEKVKEEKLLLKKQFSDDKTNLEEQLENLKKEKFQIEEQLQEEIRTLEDKLLLSEQAYETALIEKDTIKQQLDNQEEKNKYLASDIDVLKENQEEEIYQITVEKQRVESELKSLLDSKKSLEEEKNELEVQVQTLTEQLEQNKPDTDNYSEIVASLSAEKEQLLSQHTTEKLELEIQIQTLKQQLLQAKSEEFQSGSNTGPVNFFTDDTTSSNDWLQTKQSMEDKIAELELEKGNLLLQLVDVDDDEQQGIREEVIAAKKVCETQAVQHKELQQDNEATKQALHEAELKIVSLEQELVEYKQREAEQIVTEVNTICWEEKVDNLVKENKTLSEELNALRASADELSSRYTDLETKYEQLEAVQPPLEALVEIDKCDGWSDDTPQMPPEQDEGFTEDPQLMELKAALQEKEREVNEILQKQKKLQGELEERSQIMTRYEIMVVELQDEKSAFTQKFTQMEEELNRIRQTLAENETREKAFSPPIPSETGDGWGDDEAVIIPEDPPVPDNTKVNELEEELSKKEAELTKSTEKCKGLEEKLKKALKVIKQKNEKLVELKNSRSVTESMATSTISTETSLHQEPVVEPLCVKAVAYECGEKELQKELHEKAEKINELESLVRSLQKNEQVQAAADIQQVFANPQQDLSGLLVQKDNELVNLRHELSQLASTLNSKNDEIDQLMKTCGEMEKSVDEKVELLNDCVAKKDEEVRQAIVQYEDILKDATINVSHLTKEVEEKIRVINSLQAQVQEAQELLLETQNEFEAYKRDSQSSQGLLIAKEQELEGLKQVEMQLRQELNMLQGQANQLKENQAAVNEAFESGESEKAQLREEYLCLQNEYGNKNRELQMQISQLIDQLNEKESAISVMETRLKEADEQSDRLVSEIKIQLEEKTKAMELIEQTVFIKNEECIRLEEKLKLIQDGSQIELKERLAQMEEEHKNALEAFAMQNSEDLERTCEQLAKKNQEIVELHGKFNQLQQQTSQLEQQLAEKSAQLAEKDQTLLEVESLRANIKALEDSLAQYTYAYNNTAIELQGKDGEIQNLKQICSQYEEKIYASTMSQDESQRKLQEAQASLAQCQQDLGNYYNELQKSKVEVETLQKSQQEYQETVEKLNAELREAKLESQRYTDEIQTLTNQLSRTKDVEQNLNKYLEDLNAATEELGKNNMEIRELEKTITAQNTQLQTLQANVETLRSDVNKKAEVIEQNEEQISKLEAEIWELQTLKEKQESDFKNMEEIQAELQEKSKEISDLRFELEEGILQEKELKKKCEEKEQEISMIQYNLNSKDAEIAELHAKIQELSSRPAISSTDEPIAQRLECSEQEKQMLERKIDLLQNKLMEVEESEVKCYEDLSKMKILRTELEMDNLRMSAELEQLKRSLHDGDNHPKIKAMENQIVLMSETLEDRDKLCRDLMKNISELQESRDNLQICVNDLQNQNVPSKYYEGSLEATVLDLDSQLFSLRIDLDRQKRIRELYEGLLFLATSKKQFDNNSSNRSGSGGGGGWFGLADLFSTSSVTLPPASPPRRAQTPTRSRVPSSVNTPRGDESSGHHNFPLVSTPSRPLSPVRQSTGTPSVQHLFDSPPRQQQLHIPETGSAPVSPIPPIQVPTPGQTSYLQDNPGAVSFPLSRPTNTINLE